MNVLNTLSEQVAIMLPESGLKQKLAAAKAAQRPLLIKLGFDPTAPDLHLGHAVVLRKLRQFQDLGHQVIIVIGSFTASIGDPTGKNKSRPPLSREQVMQNAATYLKQLAKIIDTEKATVRFNAEWLDSLSAAELTILLSRVTLAQLLQRNDFNKRFTEQVPIAMHELLYPILQGWDSVQIKADIELGGTDQLFNCTMGRQLQESMHLEAQVVMCMPLLRGTDGKEKMSKSLGNTIGLTDSPEDMFGKTMSIPDALIPEFLLLCTDFSIEKKENLSAQLAAGTNPMLIKKAIARNIITQYHYAAAAQNAETHFHKQFQQRNSASQAFVPIQIATISAAKTEMPLCELIPKLMQDQTKSAIKRLIVSGAVQVNDAKITEIMQPVSLATGTKIRIGKRGFYELI
ncbi:tyrosine--tRNA ligase [Edaphocola aurantiacus]|uniref:tyrosine--tRNA ligase n=1 Tax=Edaphocola aurantiacus TaxID=2601682 RepID=UPI001C98C2B4|nr:tyrosine--tRNA ligase [Edaphocola aurantiacus]